MIAQSVADDCLRVFGWCSGHQGRDGTAFVSFYLADKGWSFVWDGATDHIEISEGGYGEPVRYHVSVEPVGNRIDLAAFEKVCLSVTL